MLTIENHILTIDDQIINLPHLPKPATVKVWRVPTEYRANGLFVAVTPSGEPEEIPACDLPLCEFVGEAQLPAHEGAQLAAAKDERIREVKRQAAEMIQALEWRLERAQERDRLGLPGETPEDVMLEREAIRRMSNRVEAEIMAAMTYDELAPIAAEITEADRASPARITRLQFLMRFTDEEMQAIVAAADQSPALKAALLKWQTAEGITLTYPATQAGVQALEIAGLIAPGRADAILTPPITI